MRQQLVQRVLASAAVGGLNDHTANTELAHQLAAIPARVTLVGVEARNSDRLDPAHTGRGGSGDGVDPYALFSTFAPENVRPSDATTTAPT